MGKSSSFPFGAERGSFGRRMLNRLLLRSRQRGIDYNPYDRANRARLAERLFNQHRDDHPLGTAARGRLILDMIEDSFPTEELTTAYFENLELLLKPKASRHTPGQIVLGLGSGRSGSTSLVAILATVEEHCCTHENPPLISWIPEAEELQFHVRRFQLLSHYFPLIADVSHWWLNVLDEFFTHFPDAKAVGLFRDVESCAASFMKIKGFGRGSYNHWVPYGNGIWAAAQWDPTYPTYEIPENSEREPDRVKFDLIARYVHEYNERLKAFATSMPEKFMLVKTEDLNDEAVQKAIFDFAGIHGQVAETRMNMGTTADGRKSDFKF